jgi:hypothetical protein
MKRVLEARRQKLLRELAGVHREIIKARQWLARIETRMAAAARRRDRAA